jgi:hypothetical protein
MKILTNSIIWKATAALAVWLAALSIAARVRTINNN